MFAVVCFSRRTTLFVMALVSVSRADAQSPDPTEVYEALFSQVEALGLNKTYFVREREGRFPIIGVDYPVSFPDELVFHSVEDFGRVSVSLVEEALVSGLWESDCRMGWETFHRLYPSADALTQVSQVLFSESGSEALVYIDKGSGCLGSCGATYRLTSDAGQWSVVGRLGAWCS